MNTLYKEQERAAYWAGARNGLLLATPGAGKTRTILHMLELTGERALIVAPASVARRTWQDEQKKIQIGKNIVQYAGSTETRQLTLQSHQRSHIVCSYELASECTARYADLFDCVIFDEVTRLRNPKAKRYQAIRNNIRGIPHKIGLTGTPAPNHYHQLYGSLQITAGLPMMYEQWLRDYFEPRVQRTLYGNKTRYVDAPDSLERLSPLIEPLMYRMPTGHAGEVRTIDHWVDVPKVAQVEVTMENRVRAHQLAQGRVYKKGIGGPTSDPTWHDIIHTAKQNRLQGLLEELQGEPTLIFYQFKHDTQAITAAAYEAQVPNIQFPGGPTVLNELLPDWNAKKINALVVHPASAGHGLNLQAGGRTVIWYGLPEDAELYEQGLRRLHRTGQTEAVLNHRILADCEIDRLLVDMLATKRQKLDDMLCEVK